MLLNPYRFGAAGPYTFSDAFTRADGSPGANYTDVSAGDFTGGPPLISNALTAYSFVNQGVIVATATHAFAANQSAQCVVSGFGVTASAHILLRMTAGGNGYSITTDGSTVAIYKWTAGAASLLTSVSSTVSNGATLGGNISGTTINATVNGSTVLSTTDATFSSGQPGLGLYGGSTGLTLTLDNFSASDL